MAIYHLSAKPISRSTGRSATGAAAYRAGETIIDERTGLVFDYGKKRGIDHTEIMAPANAPEWAHDRAKLWNAVEHSEKRKDSQVAREVEVALPIELNLDQQRELVRSFARSQFVDVGMVADVAIHHAKSENPHAHILLTMRDIDSDGFGLKNRSWNDKALLQNWREAWEVHTNQALEMAGHSIRIDHRTLIEQGINREPTKHLGPSACGYERRTGLPSDKRIQQEREASDRLVKAKKLGELERQNRQLDISILDLSGDLKSAVAERDQAAASGMADFRAKFELYRQVERGKQQALEAFEKLKAEQAIQEDQRTQIDVERPDFSWMERDI